MKKILVSHESPLSLLDQSRSYNDYDYALVHLFEKYPEYRQFFVNSLKQKRFVVLDNSIFELNEAFDMDKFYVQVCNLMPTAYIIPDSLENYEQTSTNILKWCTQYQDAPGLKIGVVQGKTFEELVNCYKIVDKYCDIIAISFDYSYYLESAPRHLETKELKYMRGRIHFIQALVRQGIINHAKAHHLLGCFCP